MGVSFNVMTISALSSLFFVILFSIEHARGVRFGEGIRSIFDRMLVSIRSRVRDVMPPVNDHFFQELFYFGVHKTLSFLLGTIRKLEHVVLRIVRFNRMQVVRLRTQGSATSPNVEVAKAGDEPSSSDHLTQIAEHKKENALTPREKQKRKDHAIAGDGPF